MKKILTIAFGIFITTTLFLGCSKKDNNTPPTQNTKSWAMYATVAGKTWQTDSVSGSISTDSGVSTIVIGGSTKGDTAIAIGMPEGVQPGTYDLVSGRGFNLAFVIPGADYVSASGTLNISSNSNHLIIGTFESSVSEIVGTSTGSTVSITKGFFRVTY